ncbi:MAG: hypothetical protein QM692_01865 [Thermomicrobiales bacterium]
MMTAGWRQVMAGAAAGEAAFPVTVCYPTAEPEHMRQIGPYAISAAWDAAPAPGRYPLTLLSHGSGSAPLVLRDLALQLARAGFVVAMPVHPGDNRDDRSQQGTLQTLRDRPRQLQQALEAVLADPALSTAVLPERVAVIGHSLGAYTALALAGGEPRTLPAVWPDGPSDPIPVAHDARVSALVLLAPAAVWYHAPGSLDAVRAPVLLLAGELDELAPPAHHADLLAARLPATTPLTYRIQPGAGHFSFISPFPPAMRQPGFGPALDPPGFDREAFQLELFATVTAFLRETLEPSPQVARSYP